MFGKDNCWFIHDRQEAVIEGAKSEQILRNNQEVFNMMEKLH